MPRRNGKIKLALLAAACFTIASCGLPGGKVKLPVTPLLSQASRFGVVESAYLVLKANPSADAADAGYARKGEIFELVARVRSIGKDSDSILWYGLKTEKGRAWAPSTEVELYDSREKAETASGALP